MSVAVSVAMSSSSVSSRSGASVSQAADDSDFDDEASKLEGSETSGDEDATNSGEDSSGQASEDGNVTSPGEDSCGQASEAVQNSDRESSSDANNSDDSVGQAAEAVENSDRKSSSDANDSDANHSDDSTEDKAMAVGQPIQVLETRAEHLARHIDPEVRKYCERCKYYMKERDLSSKFCFVVGPLVKTWLIEHPEVEPKRRPWRFGCAIWYALGDGDKNSRYARGDVR